MGEYVLGHERIREPDEPCETGHVIDFHEHANGHVSHIAMGAFEVHRLQRQTDKDGKVLTHMVKWHNLVKDGEGSVVLDQWEETEEPIYNELEVLTVRAGPRGVLFIPAGMRHKFICLQGPGLVRCCFPHFDFYGQPSIAFTGNRNATL